MVEQCFLYEDAGECRVQVVGQITIMPQNEAKSTCFESVKAVKIEVIRTNY